MDVIGDVFKRKKSLEIVTFLFAPLIGEMLQPFSMFERQYYLRKLLLRRQGTELVLKFN